MNANGGSFSLSLLSLKRQFSFHSGKKRGALRLKGKAVSLSLSRSTRLGFCDFLPVLSACVCVRAGRRKPCLSLKGLSLETVEEWTEYLQGHSPFSSVFPLQSFWNLPVCKNVSMFKDFTYISDLLEAVLYIWRCLFFISPVFYEVFSILFYTYSYFASVPTSFT